MEKCPTCNNLIDNSPSEGYSFIPKRRHCPDCEEKMTKLKREEELEMRHSDRQADVLWSKSKNAKKFFNKVKRR